MPKASPSQLIDPNSSTLLVIDLQQRLLPAIDASDALIKNAQSLLKCSQLLNIPTVLTEQIPTRLGPTVDTIAQLHSGIPFEKTSFSATSDSALLSELDKAQHLIVLGTETHVCVLQTVLSLLDRGHQIWVASDACGSRTDANKQAGLARMQSAGATLVTTEMVIFEWLQDAQHPKFREVLALIK